MIPSVKPATAPADTERLKRVNALLDTALALPAGERTAWLARLPPEQAELRPLLQALLQRAGVETDTFLRQPLRLDLPTADALETRDDAPGDLIGPYRLLRPLGAGGMATVWVAERTDGSLQRQEALKLPASLWAPGLARRMTAERDILASLEHPRIARLYDAGITPAGRPWLAMELVEGLPIDRHCAQHRLDVRARIRLVLQVADAVAHAHARLVVHRDLKPSNILVTPQGEVRLLDFGVAKLLGPDESPEASELTRLLGRPVTPDYAAPEQVAGRPVGVAADVYSLAIVLYELLAGQRPYRLGALAPGALEQAVREAEVPPASSRCADAASARALRGDLDTILAKALKKAPAERYPSIEAFAADLERHLAGLPVRARPDSLAYRAGKWLQRHRVGALAGALVAVAVAAGVAGTVSQARRAQAEKQAAQAQRDRALQELAYAEAADELMRFLLSEGSAEPFTTRALLERAQAQVARQFADDPRLRARLQVMLADLYGELDDYRDAERLLDQARASAGGDAALQAQADCTLAGLYAATSRIAAAREMFERSLVRLRADAAPHEAAWLTCHVQKTILHHHAGEAEAALAEAQAALALLGPQPRPGLRTNAIFLHTSVGDAQALLGRPQQAIAAYERAIAEFERIGRGNTTAAGTLVNNLGVHLSRAGQLRRASEVYARALAAERPRGRARDAALLTNQGRALVQLGDPDAALPLLEEALAQHEAKGDTRGVAFARLGLAAARCARGEAGCDSALAVAEAGLRSAVAPGHPVLASLPLITARAALAAGDAARARTLLDQRDAMLDAARPPDREQAAALALRARAALALGAPDEARRAAEAALAAARAASGGFEHTDALGEALLARAVVRGAQGEAEGARSDAAQALVQLEDCIGPQAPLTREARALADSAR